MTEELSVVGPVPAGRDPVEYDRERRRVLWSMPSGLYVVGTRAGDRANLMTISWVSQVALEPKLVGIGVEKGSVTHGLLEEGAVFVLSLLSRRDRALVRRFAKPVTDAELDPTTGTGTMHGTPVRLGSSGAPRLEVARAWLECEVRHLLRLSSHSWFVGEVVDCGESPSAADGAGEGEGHGDHAGDAGGDAERGVLRMEDTRMSYGG